MKTRKLDVIADGLTYLEGPRWHDGALWFVDFYTYGVYRVDAEGQARKIVHIEQQPSGLGWLPDADCVDERSKGFTFASRW